MYFYQRNCVMCVWKFLSFFISCTWLQTQLLCCLLHKTALLLMVSGACELHRSFRLKEKILKRISNQRCLCCALKNTWLYGLQKWPGPIFWPSIWVVLSHPSLINRWTDVLPAVREPWNVVAHELSMRSVCKSISWDKTILKTFPTC